MSTIAYIVPADTGDLTAYVTGNPPGVTVDQYIEGIPRSLIGLATIEGGLLADDTPLPVVATIPDPPTPAPAPPAPPTARQALATAAAAATTWEELQAALVVYGEGG